MIIISEQTETILLQELRKRNVGVAGHHCFYLGMSALPHGRKEIFQALSAGLKELDIPHQPYVYLCADKDIVIGLRDMKEMHFSWVVEHMAKTLELPSLASHCATWDIWLDWGKIEPLLSAKIALLQTAADQQREKDVDTEAQRAVEETLRMVEAEWEATLTQRRMIRLQPLVMIADDDQFSRTLAINLLERDYASAAARNGRETLKVYLERAPDVLFLDIGMPDISGHILLEHLLKLDPQAHIIMFSGRRDKETVLRAMQAGAKGFVGKPFTRAKIMEYVASSPFVRQKLAAA